MPRKSKNVDLKLGEISKADKEKRRAAEQKLKGNNDKLKAPTYLTSSQKKLFNEVVNELKESNILGNVDIYILSTFAISVDRLREIEKAINEDPERLLDKTLLNAKSQYTREFFRSLDQLALCPSSRAKIGSLNKVAEDNKEDPLLKLLNGGLDE